MDLDERLSCVLYRAHKLERALHEQGVWAVDWKGRKHPAIREVTGTGVRLTAKLPPAPPEPSVAMLTLDGEPFEALFFTPPEGERPFSLDWSIGVDDSIAA